MSSDQPRLAFAVIDSGPLIRGLRLETLHAERLVTVPEVLREIRDQRTRHMLDSLPVELETKEPSSEAMEAISNFAKLTGDLPALSAVDKRVLALAYMMEKEAKGGVSHLRTEPAPPRERSQPSATAGASSHTPPEDAATPQAEAMDVTDQGAGDGSPEATEAGKEPTTDGADGSNTAAKGGDADELDDDLPWISVENLKETQRNDPSRRAAIIDADTKVACLTTDYAMQSVLMQMGLKLIGADGLLMRSVKQWVLKCSGCFTMQPGLDKQFCVKCGNTSLVRLQAILDAHGTRRILPEQGAPARVRSTNTRGTKFPMPQPKAGRHANNMILAEDQLDEAMSKHRRQRKNQRSVDAVFDADYNLDDHFGRSGKKGGGGGSGAPKVGYGKRANPNDVRSRPRNT